MPADKKNAESVAWILYILPDIAIALGQFEIVYILKYEKNKLKNIDGPEFCNQSILWRDKMIKVIDLGCFINSDILKNKKRLYEYIVIIPCLRRGQEVLFLGLKIINIPVKHKVKDSQLCEFPANYDWDKLSSSCFYDDRFGIIPIVDVSKIYNYLGK